MNKKLLTVAIGAAIGAAPMFASADVKVYGNAQAEYAQFRNDGTISIYAAGNGPTTGGSTNLIAPDTDVNVLNDAVRGRLGVMADEDLGGGLKAIAKAEFIIDFADGGAGNGASGAPFAARDVFVGLQSKTLGTIRAGSFNGPYKETGTALDPFVTTNLEARNNYGMSGNVDGYSVMNGHSNFLRDAIRYTSPSFAGVQADVMVGVDGTGAQATCGLLGVGMATAADCGQGAQTNGDVSASVSWKGGPAYVFVAYNKMGNVVGAEPKAYKAGASIKFGDGIKHTINAQWEVVDRDLQDSATVGAEAAYLFLGYHLGIDKFTVSLQGGMFADSVDSDATYYMVAGTYNFSKTTRTWLGYRSTVATNALGVDVRDEGVVSLGLRSDF